MTSLRRYLNRMLIFVAAIVLAAGLLFAQLLSAFLANPLLNGLILGILLLGIGYIFRQVLSLNTEIAWIETYRKGGDPVSAEAAAPKLLGPMVTMMGERDRRLSMSAVSMRHLLDSISSRLDEFRYLSRYLIGLLIFLGLLGTFWGLLRTIDAVSDVITGLPAGTGDLALIFSNLKSGLTAPLSGMGIAFSSSLFGLAGSLILGFLDLQLGQAQNRFYNDLEEWLSGLTRLTSAGAIGDGEQSVPAYVQALLEQTAESLENLQRILARGEDSRIAANTGTMALTEKLTTLTDQMRTEQNLMVKLVESQLELKSVLARLAEASESREPAIDDATRGHIRNIEIYLARMLEEVTQGRTHTVEEIRSEIKLLARTIAAVAEEG